MNVEAKLKAERERTHELLGIKNDIIAQMQRKFDETNKEYRMLVVDQQVILKKLDNTVGRLTTVSGATAVNSPVGDYLYENGKKLYPEANPGITSFMIGVYSPVSGLSGYIDPNNSTFAPMVNGKPYQIQVQTANGDYVFNTSQSALGTAGTEDAGAPVRTLGSGTFGTYVASGVAATLSVPGGSGSAATVTINPVLGNTFLVDVPNGTMTVNGTLTIGNYTPVVVGQEFNLIVTNTNGTALNLAFGTNFIVQPITGNGFTNGLRAIFKFMPTSATTIYQISKVTY
jgi:hypothetical protein